VSTHTGGLAKGSNGFINRRGETLSFRAGEESGLGRPMAKPTSTAFESTAFFCRLLPGRTIRVPIEVFLRDTSHCPFSSNFSTCSRACDRCPLSAVCRFHRLRSGMAYGKGQSKDLIKRAVELCTLPTSPDLSSLRSGILRAVATMAASIWPRDILQPIPHGVDRFDPLNIAAFGISFAQKDTSHQRASSAIWSSSASL